MVNISGRSVTNRPKTRPSGLPISRQATEQLAYLERFRRVGLVVIPIIRGHLDLQDVLLLVGRAVDKDHDSGRF